MKLRKLLNPTFRSASSKICSIISFWPSSIRLFPTSTFKYFKKVLAIAPATIILSACSINFSINGSLSDIFAPPITATNGLSGLLKACKIVEYSFSSNKPATLGIFLAISLVEVCSRWITPKPSCTNKSAPVTCANASANSGKLFFSAFEKRKFSNISIL